MLMDCLNLNLRRDSSILLDRFMNRQKTVDLGSGYIVKEIVYNKLVRDKIPEIIEADGKTCEIKILSDDEYIKMIDAKFDEELAEYHKDQNLEELADLLEVIYAATIARGYSVKE